jgi:PTS system nitrogen regulatory IIA component
MNSSCFLTTSVHSLQSNNKYDAIHELIKKGDIYKKITNIEAFESAVINRERIQSTGIGKGVAVAHGNTAVVKSIFLILGISQGGIDFNSLDGLPVNFLFLVGNPPQCEGEYLVTLSGLIKIVRDYHFREELLKLEDTQKVKYRLNKAIQKQVSV